MTKALKYIKKNMIKILLDKKYNQFKYEKCDLGVKKIWSRYNIYIYNE